MEEGALQMNRLVDGADRVWIGRPWNSLYRQRFRLFDIGTLGRKPLQQDAAVAEWFRLTGGHQSDQLP